MKPFRQITIYVVFHTVGDGHRQVLITDLAASYRPYFNGFAPRRKVYPYEFKKVK